MLWRGNLRDVHRGHNSRDPNSKSAHHTCGDKRHHIGRKRRTYRSHKIEQSDPQQRQLASVAVRGPPANERANHSAVKSRGHGNSVHSWAEFPKRLYCFFRTGDDDRVEAEEKSGQCRGKRPEEDATVHRRAQLTTERALQCEDSTTWCSESTNRHS